MPADERPVRRKYWFLLDRERYICQVISLNEKEERLLQTIRSLPPGTTDHTLQWTSRLAELAQGRPIDWSESWANEDMRDARDESLRRFEASEPGER